MESKPSHQVNKGYLRDLGEEECWSHLGETGPVILPVNYLVEAATLIGCCGTLKQM